MVKAVGTDSTSETSVATQDERAFMQLAIEEARKSRSEGDGRVHPMVGAVVVRDGVFVGSAYRGELGAGEHGEYTLLERKLGHATLAGATVYVTLEPCTTRNHPKVCCALRLRERRVARVVIGMVDPDRRITGRGIESLRDGGIDVALFPGDLAAQVEELNREFRRSKDRQRGSEPAETDRTGTTSHSEPASRISIHNSVVHGDVVGRDKKS